MLDSRIDRGLQALALQLGLSDVKPNDTFALLLAVAKHCGHALAADGSLLEHTRVNGAVQHNQVSTCCVFYEQSVLCRNCMLHDACHRNCKHLMQTAKTYPQLLHRTRNGS